MRRVARPSPSSGVALNASGLVASSTSVTSGAATSSPTRLANSDRPFSTASPLSVADSTPRNWAVTNGSSTTVSLRLVGLVAPSMRRARSAPSPAALARSRSAGSRPTEKPKPVWVSSPSSAMVLTDT